MKGRKTIKFCIVPMCPNTTLNSPNKHFFMMPLEKEIRWLWCRAMNRENLVLRKRAICCCDDHFNLKEDTVNYIECETMTDKKQRIVLRLKKGVIPHRFDCQQPKTNPQSYMMSVETQHGGKLLEGSNGAQKQMLTPLSQYISLYSLGTNHSADNRPFTELQGQTTAPTFPPSDASRISIPNGIGSTLPKDNLLFSDDTSIPSDAEDGSVLSDVRNPVMSSDMKGRLMTSDVEGNLQQSVAALLHGDLIKSMDVSACDVVNMDHDYRMDRKAVSNDDEQTEQSYKRRRLESEPADEEQSEMETQSIGNEDTALAEIRILKTESLKCEVPMKTEPIDCEETEQPSIRTRLTFEPDEEQSEMETLKTKTSNGKETQHPIKRRRLKCGPAGGEHKKLQKQRANIDKSITSSPDHTLKTRHKVKFKGLKDAAQTIDLIGDNVKSTNSVDEDSQSSDDDFQPADDDSQSSSDQDEPAPIKSSRRNRHISRSRAVPPRIKSNPFSENVTTGPPAAASNSTSSESQPDITRKNLDRREFDYGSDDDELIFNSIPRAQRILLSDFIDSSTTLEQTPEDEPPELPTTAKPSSLFEFNWKPLPASTPTWNKREVFKVNSGPTKSYSSPYEVFKDIWDEIIMLHIVSETNRYAKELINKLEHSNMLSGSKLAYWNKWYDTDADEMFIYFAVLLSMGITVKSDVQEYWSDAADIFETPNYGRYITFDRFQRLSRCLHFNSNDFDISFLSVPEARLYKVQPIVEHLNQRFQELYLMGQNVVLDESLAQWKDKLNTSEYIKSKQKSDGFKSYELCDATNGYLWRFKLHAGPEIPSKESPIFNFTSDVILHLTKDLENKGYTLWMDHYYNSPALARVLKSRGIDCVGTLRTNRPFVPNSFAILTKHNMAVGELHGCSSGDVDLIIWKNQNRIAMISTYHGLATLSNSNGETSPKVFCDYNENIAAIDKKDRMLAMFPIERRKSDILYKKFFRRLLNVSVLNSYIIFKENNCTNPVMSHRNFRKALIKEVLFRHKPSAMISLTGRSQPSVVFSEEMLRHLPAEYPIADGWQPHSCVLCRKSIQTCCPGCDVALCAIRCFGRYHTESKSRLNS